MEKYRDAAVEDDRAYRRDEEGGPRRVAGARGGLWVSRSTYVAKGPRSQQGGSCRTVATAGTDASQMYVHGAATSGSSVRITVS